jgi:glycosyltransferase involved in cell wall biosynthesis
MRLLMISGDRQVVVGERGPFHSMMREFSRYFERIDVLCPRAVGPVTTRTIHGRVHFHPAPCGRAGMANYIRSQGSALLGLHGHELIVSHDYGWFYNGVGSALLSRRTGIPYVSEIHHVPGYPVAADMRESFDRFVAKLYVNWARDRAVAFRVVNHEEMPHLLRTWRVPESKILVLPSLYVDFDVFHPRPGEEGAAQDVLFVGRMVRNKGVARILGALARLRAKGLALRALFVGKGPLRARLRTRAAELGLADSATFLEWIGSPLDLARIYRQSRVCVCASTCEGGPRFTVEAMACGTPVVSTPVGVMGELLGDGAAGALAGFDEKSLAEAIEHVLSDEGARRAMGACAIEIARPYEYSRAIGVYANGLRRLVGQAELVP